MRQKRLEKMCDALSDEFSKGFDDFILFGVEVYDVSGDTPRNIPYLEFIEKWGIKDGE